MQLKEQSSRSADNERETELQSDMSPDTSSGRKQCSMHQKNLHMYYECLCGNRIWTLVDINLVHFSMYAQIS